MRKAELSAVTMSKIFGHASVISIKYIFGHLDRSIFSLGSFIKLLTNSADPFQTDYEEQSFSSHLLKQYAIQESIFSAPLQIQQSPYALLMGPVVQSIVSLMKWLIVKFSSSHTMKCAHNFC